MPQIAHLLNAVLKRPTKTTHFMAIIQVNLPSVLWCCWLGGRKGIRPVKTVAGCWHGYLSGVRCRLAYGPADATATHCLCSSKIQIGFTFLVPANPGSPGKRAVKRVCVYRSTCVSQHLQLRTGGFCWCEVLLPACRCWQQPAHSD